MTYPNAHLLLTLHWGASSVPAEQFQTGFRFDSTSPATQALVDSAATPISAFWTTATNRIEFDFVLLFARLASIGTDGKYVPGTIAYDHSFGVLPGGGSSGAATYRFPLQCSTASRLLTAETRGQAHAGRVYLPAIDQTLGSGHLINMANCDTRSNALSAMLSSLNTIMPGDLSIFSKGTKAQPTVGAKRVVTGVRTDNRMDVQRRRANQQPITLGALFNVTT